MDGLDIERRSKFSPGSRRELKGQRFGFLVVERYSHYEDHRTYWWCQCDCGQRVRAMASRLVAGRKKACGVDGHAWRDREPRKPSSQHPSEYGSWRKMWERCTLKDRHNWHLYGGRGIKVCTRWESFDQFLADMGPKPTLKHTIERNDNDKGYQPDNCRWATRDEQRRNQRRSVYVEHEGERVLLVDLCERLGLSYALVYGRIKNGWLPHLAITTPSRSSKSALREI